ncbi:uncharacterized protein SPPG_02701 [Spizellomyces punctatus DAOM BR117]|uniref:AAA+ ATPase domain-containing protein n=1 Tax=Spizellomyces punctatus (strain DAOM BR117) TaxID=645134 RepID=A0A0L0HLA4_SPIPD|nr:uncharacterized protein SPPG_02701 [Spizellomyces punctatus DAOM BR117]KND02216.1 hypothetical protein SPPG_02701 [Spizellomyces punctatus DAOM BR117]|eukprot:XP_016610255.1 hypothetical protein SPPG_02701 [Spizellomyces punctatus DAOM BR117]
MSNRTYNQYWAEANKQLADQLEYESPKDPNLLPKDREAAFQHLALLYVKYIQIFRRLEEAYDQIVHPQKRRLMKDVVLATMGRILELKHKMVELELTDFFNFGDILLDLKLTPDDLRIPVPRCFVEERGTDIEQHKTLLDGLGAKEFGFGEAVPPFPPLKISEAIRIIQINERGRQGRLRAKYMRDIKLQAQREKELDQNEEEMEVNTAAVRIQKVYKGYKARQFYKKQMHEEMIFLGMANIMKDPKNNPMVRAENNRNRRKVVQLQHEEEYQQALVNTREKIMRVEGPDMKEALQDSFRQWYMEYKRINSKFPDFPADKVWQEPGFKFELTPEGQIPPAAGEADGSGAGESKPSTAASATKGGKGGKGGKGAKGKDAGKGGKDAKKGAAGKKGGKQEETEDPNKFKFDDSPFLTSINTERSTYGEKWLRKDETENFAQKHDQEIVKNEKRREVEAEIKGQVMEILKEELKNLKMAVDREKAGKSRKGKKGKKGGKGKKGKKGGKKGGKGKGGKKGKKEKDLTANRTMESLVEELIQAGILQKYPSVSMEDFKGEFDLLASSSTKTPVIKPTLGELQRAVTEYCVLPLGFSEPMQVPAVSSVLLFGPKGAGKSMLVNAVASELGAWLFNLTPRNTAGQYVGKSNVAKMVHMVFKVAKAHPPSIVYIDNVEMIFAKKVPKDDTSDPKRIKKDLLKAVKGLKPVDRVMVMGTSNKPWDGDVKAMMPVFGKQLPVPAPDYPSRNALWTYFIGRRIPAAVKDIDISLLTRMSDGLSTGQIALACERALTDRRLKLLRLRPFTTNELVEQILNMAPFDKNDDKPYWDFYEKIPLVKKRTAMLAAPLDDEGDKGKKKGGGKDAKKKKK